MKLFITVCLFVACAIAVPNNSDDYMGLFKTWKGFYQKTYKSLVSYCIIVSYPNIYNMHNCMNKLFTSTCYCDIYIYNRVTY